MAIQTLFKYIETVREYISVDISHDINKLLPYIKQAEKFTTDIIGSSLHSALLNIVQNETEDAALQSLLPYVQLPLINFAYMLGGSKLAVNIGQTGISTTENDNLTPAEEWRLKDLKTSFASAGYDGLEELLRFLEENKDDYPLWESSASYSYQKKYFINNAKELNETIDTNFGRYDFLKLKPFIHQIERSVILPRMCETLFTTIKDEIKDGNVSEDNQTLLDDYIKPAVCYLAIDKLKPDENFKLEGTRYAQQLKDYLNSNADTYTDYASSDCYEDPETESDLNDEDSGFFVMGRY